jgi:hypothetical protein
MSKITGTIISKGDVVVVSDKFQKIEFVVETEEQYPQKLQIQFTQDKVNLMQYYKIGSVVEVNVNIKGREWVNPATGKVSYFLSLDAWSISLKGGNNAAPASKPMGNIESNFQEEAIRDMQEDDDDLPF